MKRTKAKNVETVQYIHGSLKREKGITLIALVITIIILLILAGITIATLNGNGLFTKAEEAKQKSKNAQELENGILLNYEEEIKQQLDGHIEYNKWTTLLELAGIQNVDEYNEQDIVSNQDIMNKIMNNEKAVNYMIKSVDSIMSAIINSEIAMEEIGNSTIAKNKISESSAWIKAINNSENKEIIFTNLLPIMTSNEQDGITLTVSDYQTDGTTGEAFRACDGNQNTCWSTLSENYDPHWFTIEFNKKHIITSYYLNGAYVFKEGVVPKFYLQASNDNENWTNLEGDTIHEGSATALKEYNIQLENTTAYKYYRFYFPEGGWTWGLSGGMFIADLKLFGI